MYDNKIVGSEYLFQSFLIKLFNKLGYKIETEVQKKILYQSSQIEELI